MYFIETPPWQRLRTPPLLPLCAISLRRDKALEVEAADHVLELVDAFGLSFGFHLEAVADHDAVLAALGPAVPLFPDALAIADVGLLVAVRALAFGFAAKGACHRHHPAHGRHVGPVDGDALAAVGIGVGGRRLRNLHAHGAIEIGRAAVRERVCQYV